MGYWKDEDLTSMQQMGEAREEKDETTKVGSGGWGLLRRSCKALNTGNDRLTRLRGFIF